MKKLFLLFLLLITLSITAKAQTYIGLNKDKAIEFLKKEPKVGPVEYKYNSETNSVGAMETITLRAHVIIYNSQNIICGEVYIFPDVDSESANRFMLISGKEFSSTSTKGIYENEKLYLVLISDAEAGICGAFYVSKSIPDQGRFDKILKEVRNTKKI